MKAKIVQKRNLHATKICFTNSFQIIMFVVAEFQFVDACSGQALVRRRIIGVNVGVRR